LKSPSDCSENSSSWSYWWHFSRRRFDYWHCECGNSKPSHKLNCMWKHWKCRRVHQPSWHTWL